MNFERLKKSHLKRNIIIGVVAILIISAIILNFTRAKYRVTQSIPLVNGTINYTPYDFKMVAMYQINEKGEYDSIDEVPETGYILNKEKSYCDVNGIKDNNITMNFNNGTVNIGIKKKGTKCYLYFDEALCSEGAEACNTLLSNYPTKLTRNDFSTPLTELTNQTIYYEDTSKGKTYYFAGNPSDNWLKFAGFYWRIIRINENGSIRMIYQGVYSGEDSAQTTGTETQIQTGAYNSSYNDNAYVGYMYGSLGANSYYATHANNNSSTIKGVLDSWYQENLISYASKIDGSAGFCGDRTPSTSWNSNNGNGGNGTLETYYGPYLRIYGDSKKPTFECQNENDLYTTKESMHGNKVLNYPIGLISMDEAWYAGGYISNNNNYYLYTGEYYWTFSPAYYGFYSMLVGDSASVFSIYSDGKISDLYVTGSYGIRPVINLKADVTITGSGTTNDPYVLS